jgi:hypothetical protein
MKDETAGEPIGGLKWTRKTTKKIAKALEQIGIHVSANTVARLLKQLKFRLRLNHKKRSTASPVDRDRQFRRIKRMRKHFASRGLPIISVDAKKRELVGNFKNAGASWRQHARETLDHDFRSLASGVAIPYGLYDPVADRGFVVVGTSRGTAAFSVDCLATWWRMDGRHHYPEADHLLVLADGGGGNGSRCTVWMARLQRFCDQYGIHVTVCHYPPGTSKWNPVEHFLFNHISRNWEGEPLDSYEKVLKFIRTTTTEAGLKVRAILNTKDYPTGVTASADELAAISIRRHRGLPKWNYTISPQS